MYAGRKPTSPHAFEGRPASPQPYLTHSASLMTEREGVPTAIWVFISFHYITFMAHQMLPFTVNGRVSYDLPKLWRQ